MKKDLQIPPDFKGPYTTALQQAITPTENENGLLAVLRGQISNAEKSEEEDILRIREISCYYLANLYVAQSDANKLASLFIEMRPLVPLVTRARTAKITRKLVDTLSEIPDSLAVREKACLETIEWCKAEKRTFLRQRVEARLAQTLLAAGKVTSCLDILSKLLREVKQMDDKLLLVEIFHIEAKAHFLTRSLAKAKAALTGARTAAHAVHCPPLLQAEVDVLAGALYLEDGDAKTAFSYFVEPFETYAAAGESKRAQQALKYLMLSKILDNQPKDVINMAKQAVYVNYAGRDVDSMVAVARSVEKRDLAAFERALRDYASDLRSDPIVERHIQQLYQKLLESNLQKLLEPYSQVEIEHVAQLIELPTEVIGNKLCEMVLDKKLRGCIHQERGVLQLFGDVEECKMYVDGDTVFSNLLKVSGLLHKRVGTAL